MEYLFDPSQVMRDAFAGAGVPYSYYQSNLGTSQITNPTDTWNNFLQMYMPNAFQAAMLNYQNEYNSPVNQMLRYQEAGINPYGAVGNIRTESASGSPGAAPGTSHTPGVLEKIASIAKNAVGAINPALDAAIQLFDYMNYGRERSRSSMLKSQYDATRAQYESAWSEYWNAGIDSSRGDNAAGVIGSSPRAKYMAQSTSRLAMQIKQLETMVDSIYPSQKEANDARAALQNYLREVQQGRNQAVLDINTGSKTADAILQFLVYLLQDNAGNLLRLF